MGNGRRVPGLVADRKSQHCTGWRTALHEARGAYGAIARVAVPGRDRGERPTDRGGAGDATRSGRSAEYPPRLRRFWPRLRRRARLGLHHRTNPRRSLSGCSIEPPRLRERDRGGALNGLPMCVMADCGRMVRGVGDTCDACRWALDRGFCAYRVETGCSCLVHQKEPKGRACGENVAVPGGRFCVEHEG